MSELLNGTLEVNEVAENNDTTDISVPAETVQPMYGFDEESYEADKSAGRRRGVGIGIALAVAALTAGGVIGVRKVIKKTILEEFEKYREEHDDDDDEADFEEVAEEPEK